MRKSLALILVGLLGSTTIASAENHLSSNEVQVGEHTAIFRMIRTDGPGLLEVYGVRAGREGVLLGSKALQPGVNTYVRVPLRGSYGTQGLAVLMVDGEAVATQRLRFAH